MIVIMGGAHQGKLEYARNTLGFDDSQIFFCETEKQLDLSKPCICGLHLYILGALQRGENPIDFINASLPSLKENVVICDDICSGVVPIEHINRLWRDNTGKIMQVLCRNADEVVRLFCGLPEKLK